MKQTIKQILTLMATVMAGAVLFTFIGYCRTVKDRTDDYGFKNERLHVRRNRKTGNLTVFLSWKVVQRKVGYIQEATMDPYLVFSKNGRYGFLDSHTGKTAIPATFRKAWPFSEGLAGVQRNGMVGFVDHRGHVVIGFDYPAYGHTLTEYVFQNGFCAVAGPTGKIGIIDKTGSWVIQPEYDYAATCKGYAVVAKDGMQMQMSYDGRILNPRLIEDVVDLHYSREDSLYDEKIIHTGCYAYCVGGLWGLMDADGARLTMPLYSGISALNGNIFRAILLDDRSEILMDKHGKEIK